MNFFFQAVVNSVYNMRWLSSMKSQIKKAMGYYLFFVLLVSLFLSIPLVNVLYSGIDNVERYITKELPAFTAEIKSGELSLQGFSEPYKKQFAPNEPFWLVVDTQTTSTEPNVTELVSGKNGGAILFTKTGLSVYEIRDGVERTNSVSWRDIKQNTTFTNETLVGFVNKIKGGVKFGITLGILLMVYMVLLAGKALYLLFVALIAFIVARIAKRQVSYGQIYTMGLFALTLPTLFTSLVRLFGLNIPFFYTLILLVLLLGAIFTNDAAPNSNESAPSQA